MDFLQKGARIAGMRYPTRAVIAGLLLVGSILCSTGRGDDASTPKGAMKVLMDAMHRADADAVKADSINGDPQLIDLMCALTTATTKSRDAAVAKFGQAARDVFPDTWAQAAKSIDDVQVQEDGDTATLTSSPNSPNSAVRLKKIDGVWKIDFASIPGMSNTAAMRSTFQKIIDANNEVTDEINAGKYSSAQDASAAVNAKMMTAMRTAAPTTQK
jgi:hypothetical protein